MSEDTEGYLESVGADFQIDDGTENAEGLPEQSEVSEIHRRETQVILDFARIKSGLADLEYMSALVRQRTEPTEAFLELYNNKKAEILNIIDGELAKLNKNHFGVEDALAEDEATAKMAAKLGKRELLVKYFGFLSRAKHSVENGYSILEDGEEEYGQHEKEEAHHMLAIRAVEHEDYATAVSNLEQLQKSSSNDEESKKLYEETLTTITDHINMLLNDMRGKAKKLYDSAYGSHAGEITYVRKPAPILPEFRTYITQIKNALEQENIEGAKKLINLTKEEGKSASSPRELVNFEKSIKGTVFVDPLGKKHTTPPRPLQAYTLLHRLYQRVELGQLAHTEFEKHLDSFEDLTIQKAQEYIKKGRGAAATNTDVLRLVEDIRNGSFTYPDWISTITNDREADQRSRLDLMREKLNEAKNEDNHLVIVQIRNDLHDSLATMSDSQYQKAEVLFRSADAAAKRSIAGLAQERDTLTGSTNENHVKRSKDISQAINSYNEKQNIVSTAKNELDSIAEKAKKVRALYDKRSGRSSEIQKAA